ncbi:MAG TPA: outer membrane beta-barrel protein [Thermoanaerobaculia bacterium]
MNFPRRFLFLTAIAVALAGPACADVFDFRVRLHNHPGIPAARVFVTLETSGAPAGSTLSVAGGAASPLPAVLLDGGDQTTAILPAGLNQVRIEFIANSQFTANNYCALAMGMTGEKDVNMTLNTPAGVTVTGYRINTYGSPGSPSCGLPFRRLGGAEAELTQQNNAPLAIANKGRHPIDVILVLDESGSMSLLPPNVGAGDNRWQILEKAVTAFVQRWQVIDAPVPPKEWSGDRIGVVFFTTNATNHSFMGSFFRARGTNPPGMGHDWQAVIGALAGHGPSDMTAMGKGINNALDQWIPLSPLARNDAAFVIFTDGIQNIDPLVKDKCPIPNQNPCMNPTTIQELVPTGGGNPVELWSRGIPMQTIAFGTPESAQATLLNRISNQTSGTPFQAADAFGTFDAFGNALVGLLKGSTISLAHRSTGTLAAAPGPLVPVEIDASVERAVFSVEWMGSRANMLDLQLFPPGVTPGPADTGVPATQTAGSTSSLSKGWDMPASGPTGTWHVRVVRRFGADAASAPVPYNLSAYMLEGRLKFHLTVDQMEPGTGDPIGVRAQVAFNSEPLEKLPDGAIRVRIRRPGESFGTILHDTVIDIPQRTGSDATTPYDRKVQAMEREIDRITPRDADTITLTPIGDGIYTGSFTGNTVAGRYHFDTTLDWDVPETGRIRRIERTERVVKVNADPEGTRISSTRNDDGTVTVTVTPRDRFGNYAGPGYGHRIGIASANGRIAGPPSDPNQTGDYVFTVVDVPKEEEPKIDFTYEGRPIGGTMGGGRGGDVSTGSGSWRFFIDAGINSPDASALDGSYSVNAGLERILTPKWSVEGILGYHTFDGPFVAPDVWQLSANAKYFFLGGPLRPFVNGGVGLYRVDPPDDTEFGFNAGAGLLYELNAKWGVEGVYNLHSTDPLDWWTLQLGLRWHF